MASGGPPLLGFNPVNKYQIRAPVEHARERSGFRQEALQLRRGRSCRPRPARSALNVVGLTCMSTPAKAMIDRLGGLVFMSFSRTSPVHASCQISPFKKEAFEGARRDKWRYI